MKHFYRKIQHLRPNFLFGFLAIGLFLVLPALTLAAPGDLDPTFGVGGKLTDWSGSANGVAIQPDGKIVVAGLTNGEGSFAVARYNPDGSPDTAFGSGDGKVITDIGFSHEYANAVAIQADGKIVALGTTWDGSASQWGHFSLVRYNSDGSLDPAFGGGGGIVVTENLGTGWVAANSVAIQSDGKIVAAGRSDYRLYDFPELIVIRYNPDGSLDLSFGGGDGKAQIPWAEGPFGGYAPPVEDATSVAIQPDGKIVAAGYSYGFSDFSALVRLNSNGSLDQTFGGGDGIVFTDIGPGADTAHSVAIQPDGKIVTAGSSNNGSNADFALVRYNPDGSLDTSFDGDGIATTPIGSGDDFAKSVVIQSDNKIVAAGGTYNGSLNDFALARYNPSGSLDTTFGGGDGITTLDFDDLPDLDNSYDNAYGMALDSRGRAVLVGVSDGRSAIARFLLAPRPTRFDFDGDGRTDISVFRPTDRIWYLNQSTKGFSATQFGLSTDIITPADFDGDGKTDISVFRDGNWYWLNSSNGNFNAVQFGLAGDVPVPADYTGDGRAELAVYRSGNWYTLNLANNQFQAVQFGISTDKPVVGDYDGDSRADYAVYRDGTWYLLQSTQGFAAIQFGLSTDKLVPADYDGDGRTDVAVYRDGVWYVLQSSQGFTAFQFGIASDVLAPADYDGDGRADATVFRDGVWYLRQSTNGFAAQQFGIINDEPVPTAYLP